LGQLDRSRLNIRTLEDPVEFTVPWITQIPIGQGTGRDYASGLKSLLRQAPHVILLGELRDRAAAQTCMEAVETGHLLLATLHTRDAVGVVSRLLDLGLTGRQIAAGLRLAVGQRLVPRVCDACRKSRLPTPAERSAFADLQLEPPIVLWEGAGCPACGARGETGLVPVFEIFRPGAHESLEELVACATAASFNERELRRRWLKSGGEPLVRSALKLAADGVITFRAAHLLF
jgi:type II secretory ATPase GspE/PulE/Tfp pilus assembly ATPase PilB-like protein